MRMHEDRKGGFVTDAWLWPWSGAYVIATFGLLAVALVLTRASSIAARRVSLIALVVTSTIYLSWRLLETIPTETPWSMAAGIMLISAELVGTLQLIAMVAIVWRRNKPAVASAPVLSDAASLPSVDIFITTYDESTEVLEPTVAGALGIRYPGTLTVYLCDDGSRESMKDLADRYGIVHLTRDEHAHAKAGNLNNALANSSGDLVVTLDADMIPRASFLEATVGLFDDAMLAFVQAPQAFHNDDPFQYNLFSQRALPNEQDYFMRSLQQGKAQYNAVMYVGSNTVFRRSALEHIGGFATGVITEDMATGMLLQAAGYRAEFVPEVIAAGLAPESFATLLTQRTRWSRGNIQTVRRWNPVTLPGLSFMQRWLYLDGIIYWHFGILKMIFVVAPLLYLLAGITVVDADLPSVMLIWAPYFATSLVAMRIISGGRRSSLWTHVYETAMAPTVALAVLAEWVGLSNKAFAVTPKGVSSSGLNFRLAIAAPNVALLVLSIAALLNGWVVSADRYVVDSLIITTFWTLYNIAGLAMAILVCLERPRHRSSERTEVTVAARAGFWPGSDRLAQVLDLSVGGARVLVPWTVDGGRAFALTAPRVVPHLTIAEVGDVPGVIRWVKEVPQGLLVGFEFADTSAAHTIGIVRHITNSPKWVRSDREEGARILGAARRTLVGTAQRVKPSLRSEARLTTRGLATLRNDKGESVVHLEDLSFGGCRIRTRGGLAVGDHVMIGLSDQATLPRAAAVRWVERRGRRQIAGLKFELARSEEKVS